MRSYIEVVDVAVDQHRTTDDRPLPLAGSPTGLSDVVDDGAVPGRDGARLARIKAVNPTLNALVQATDPLGRAHGLPIAVKDVMRVAGLVCFGGSPALKAVAAARIASPCTGDR
jgi:hypothetical protein